MPSLNIKMIKFIAEGLGELNKDVVYVGGSVIELYASNVAAADEIRATEDVDVVIRIASRNSFQLIEEQLREKGFSHDISEGAPICRWVYKGVKLDLMPDDPSILGFNNRWYIPGCNNKKQVQISDTISIFIFPVSYYLASKFEAIQGRGQPDIRQSHDFEDVVFIFDNCDSLETEINSSDTELQKFIREYLTKLSKNPYFREAINCFFLYGSEDRAEAVIHRINAII